ncbi:hypothetical protein WI29_23015 [Burkholderia ubonensis]|nr:hypothetical protein WI31_11110 [Burkholderia ubonensis]KUZ14050.1 hypothetical protein WI29_23015 [Burkholderia ubonensis]KUZ23630.1 hypothetical protein WI30_30630 [Burkholderia ubonensis]KUZ47173.1 hypothetical protein WI33_22605 [Burkholderia ubonensis]KUZ58616.1 hypothetical protein WI34_13995 [Burkholderia ubonensis]
MDVVKSVARNISTEEFEREFRAREQECGQTYFSKIGGALNRQIRTDHTCNVLARTFQISSAAAGLEDFLRHSTAHVLRWFDWGTTGRPRLDDAVSSLGMEALIHLAQYNEKCVDAWESGKFNLREWSDGLRDVEEKFNKLDHGFDLAQIGFEQRALFEFLAQNKIPYAIEDLEGECLLTNPQLFERVEAVEVVGERTEQAQQFKQAVGQEPRLDLTIVAQCATPTNPTVVVGDTDSGDFEHNEALDGADSRTERSQAQRLSEAALKELPRNLTTSELAAAFADMDDCMYQTGRDYDKWKRYLQDSLPKWAVDPKIRVQKGSQGRLGTARWDPLEFAIRYVSRTDSRKVLDAFDERFGKVAELEPWKGDWSSRALDLRLVLRRR